MIQAAKADFLFEVSLNAFMYLADLARRSTKRMRSTQKKFVDYKISLITDRLK